MKSRKLISVTVALISTFFTAGNVFANDNVDYKGWNASLGGGMMFWEGDEEVEHSQIYGVSVGYDFNNRWTLAGSFGYLPYMNNEDRELIEPTTEFELDQSTWGLRFGSDLLYHVIADTTSAFDPFAGLTGGMMYYGDDLENGQQWDPYGGITAGLTYWLPRGIGVRGDYRVLVAGHDTEFNQQVMLSLTYSWGRRAMAVAGEEANDNLAAGYKNVNLDKIYFKFDSSELSATSKQILKKNSVYLASVPGSKIILEGHCDERGTVEYNLALGARRAQSAFNYLRSLGVSPDRMTTISYGESRPADPASNESAWSKNRRVECLEAK